MANYNLFRGGTPNILYAYCGCTRDFAGNFGNTFRLPIMNDQTGIRRAPPTTGHIATEWAVGRFTYPFVLDPKGNDIDNPPLQRNMLRCMNIQAGDVLFTHVLPSYSYVSAFEFSLMADSYDADGNPIVDANMAGAQFEFVAFTAEYDPDNSTADENGFVYTEVTSIASAMTAQGVTSPVNLGTETEGFVSLVSVAGTATVDPDTGAGTSSGWAVPLYVAPGTALLFGIRIISVPSNADFGIADMATRLYLGLKVDEFNYPSQTI